jgi:hypothetical protein
LGTSLTDDHVKRRRRLQDALDITCAALVKFKLIRAAAGLFCFGTQCCQSR